jgi:UDP-glucose 4-epimerase
MQKVLVTGSSGSIGTGLSEKLLAEGYEFVGADIRPNEWHKNIDAKTIRVDLTDKSSTEKLLPKDVGVIIHLAAHSRVWDLVQNPHLALENIAMLENVLEFARTNNIKKVIFASSREVYGGQIKDSYREEDASVDGCENPYAMSKIAGEAMLRAYKRSYGIDSIILRFANVYGRYDTLNRVIPLFIAHCHSGKGINIFGKDKIMDFTYLDDTVSGIMLALTKFDDVRNDVFNIASGVGTSLTDLAFLIQEGMKTNVEIKTEENRTGEVMRYVGNIEKSGRILGYAPQVTFDEGLLKAIEWYSDFYAEHPERMPELRA